MAKKIKVERTPGIAVIATEMGYYNNKLMEPGEEFEVDAEDELGSWMERKDGKENWAAGKRNITGRVLGIEQDFPEPDKKVLAKSKKIEKAAIAKESGKKAVTKKRPSRAKKSGESVEASSPLI